MCYIKSEIRCKGREGGLHKHTTGISNGISNGGSINRPAWIQYDLHSYLNRYFKNGKIIYNYKWT